MECIEHNYATERPQVTRGRQYAYLYRHVYCESHGIALDSISGKVVRHTCDNPRCINPDHLVIGTQLDNIQDMNERGRRVNPTHSAHGRAKLTEQDVAEIRAAYVKGSTTHGAVALAKSYGVNNKTIWCIVRRVTWR